MTDDQPTNSQSTSPQSTNLKRRYAAAAILLLAFALRLYRLGAESLWYDETVSVYLAGESLPDLVAHTARDIHPPGYYLLLHGWTRQAGRSEFAAAFLSLWFGVVLVALAERLGRRLFGAKAGLLAALLVALSPFNLWYSQEVRMYTLGAALGMGLLLATLCLLTEEEGGRRGRCLALYALCGALGLWVLYYFAFLLIAVNLMVGLWWLWKRRSTPRRWPFARRWLPAQGAVLLLYAPWLPIAWRQATEPPVPPWRSFTGLGDLLVQTWTALSLGQSVEAAQVWPGLLLFALLFALPLIERNRHGAKAARPGGWRSNPRAAWPLAGYVFLPVLLIYLASFITPLFHARYVFTYSTPFYILIAAGLARLGKRWRPAARFGLAAILALSAFSIYAYHTDPRYAADDHRGAVRFLAERWRPGDAILVNAGYTYTALEIYWEGDPIAWRGRLVGAEPPYDLLTQGPLLLQTGTVDGEPSLGWGDPRADFYAMSRAETEAALTQLFAHARRVWVYRIYDTVTDPQGFIRAWLEENSTLLEDRVFTGESQLRVQCYRGGRDPLAGAEPRRDAAFSDGPLTLLAEGPLPGEVTVGGVLDLAPVWRVESPLREEAILFAGLFDAQGRRRAQTDERPLGSRYPVTAWPPGETVRTPLRLAVPVGTPPGEYQLQLGWYTFVEGQPLWLPRNDGQRQPYQLGPVRVRAPADWAALPPPEVAYPAGVTLGSARLPGFEMVSMEANPGGSVAVDLFWQAERDGPEAGPVVLQLADDAGRVWAEESGPPAGGLAPFVGLEKGQVVRDPRILTLPEDLPPGVYNLRLGRRRPDGAWLPVRRGPITLGTTYPLATVRVAP